MHTRREIRAPPQNKHKDWLYSVSNPPMLPRWVYALPVLLVLEVLVHHSVRTFGPPPPELKQFPLLISATIAGGSLPGAMDPP